MKNSRKLTNGEINVIRYLAEKGHYKLYNNWSEIMRVVPMPDGGMGSLHIVQDEKPILRKFGKQISECKFMDKDGVLVIVSLYIDQFNDLYELDVWKADFSPLLDSNFRAFARSADLQP